MDFPSDYEDQYDEDLARAEEERETDPADDTDTVIGELPAEDTDPDAVVGDMPVLETDPEEEDPSEEYPTDDELEWGDPPVSPQTVRDFPVTPPRSLIVIEDSDEMIPDGADTEVAEDSDEMVPDGADAEVAESFEEEIPDDTDIEVAPEGESESPPPPPIPVMPVIEHELIVAQHTAELAVAHARVEELRMQLTEERQERRRARREMERRLAHRESRGSILRRVRRATRRAEQRALTGIRALSHGRRIRSRDAERVLERAMLRVREATRSHDD